MGAVHASYGRKPRNDSLGSAIRDNKLKAPSISFYLKGFRCSPAGLTEVGNVPGPYQCREPSATPTLSCGLP